MSANRADSLLILLFTILLTLIPSCYSQFIVSTLALHSDDIIKITVTNKGVGVM